MRRNDDIITAPISDAERIRENVAVQDAKLEQIRLPIAPMSTAVS